MIATLKKTMLAGLGAAVVTKDKVEAALGDFVAQGKVSAAVAKAMATKIAADSRREFDEAGDKLNAKLKDVAAKFSADTREQLAELAERVAALEKKAKSATRTKKS